jgi:hypothetical protein
MLDAMTATAAQDGLGFRFDLMRGGSTFDAHRLLHLAAERGVQDAMKERLLRATFTEGEPTADHEVLVRLAAEVGLAAEEAREVLASDRYAAEVRADERRRSGRHHGVPSSWSTALRRSGAQPADGARAGAGPAGGRRPLQLVPDRRHGPAATGRLRRDLSGRTLAMPAHVRLLPDQPQLLSLPAGAAPGRRGGRPGAAGQDVRRVRGSCATRNRAAHRAGARRAEGGALKAGQLLSTVEALMPQDPESTWRDALVTLQDSNSSLPFGEVEPVLRRELGEGWRALFRSFDEQAVAAASLGAGAPRGLGRRPSGCRQGAVPRRAGSAGCGRAHPLGGVPRGGARGPRAGGAAAGARAARPADRGAGLRARGAHAGPLRRRLRRRSRGARARDRPQQLTGAGHGLARRRAAVGRGADGRPGERDRRSAGCYQRFLVSGPSAPGSAHRPAPRQLPRARRRPLGVSTSVLARDARRHARHVRPLIDALLGDDPQEVLRRLREERFVPTGRAGRGRQAGRLHVAVHRAARHEVFRFSRAWLQREFGRSTDPRNPTSASR